MGLAHRRVPGLARGPQESAHCRVLGRAQGPQELAHRRGLGLAQESELVPRGPAQVKLP